MKTLVFVALLAACNGFDPLAQPSESPRPFANAGIGSSYPLSSLVTLDGSGSFDPAGNPMTFRWSVVQSPSGSTALPVEPTATVTTFQPDQLGTYRLRLDVTDTALATDSSEVRIVATGAITGIEAGADRPVQWLTTVQLGGDVSTVAGKVATYSWSFVMQPAGSAATLQAADTLHPTFLADAAGTYVVELDARVGDEVRRDRMTVQATAVGIQLGTGIAAYVYATAIDRLFYLHDVGHAELVKMDPMSGTKSVLDVGAFTSRSLAIDGTNQFVVVGGAGKVGLVGMNAFVLSNLRDATNCSASAVASPAQYEVHCFPYDGSLEPITTVNMSTGQLTQTPSPAHLPFVVSTNIGRIYMVDGASGDFYVFDGNATPPFTTPLVHTTMAGIKGPIIAGGTNQPYAITGNGLAFNENGTVRFDLHTSIDAGASYGSEVAVVSGTQLDVFDTVATPSLVKTAVIPSVNGDAPMTKLVAYSADGHRLIIVAGTFLGDVLYEVPR